MAMKAPHQQDVAIRSAFVRRVADTVKRTRLFRPGDAILVAVSGGPDSVALLSVLASLAPSWRLRVQAVHFNYGLRGDESEEDSRFVARLCARMGIELISEPIDLRGAHAPSSAWKMSSLQEAAREARYSAMMRIGTSLSVDKIALGHTADDQAETVLMWMIRGAGPAGLSGIPPVRNPIFIRPLLQVERSDVLDYLKTEDLTFRTDSTNAKPVYVRNRIRRDLLPLLKQFNPSIVEVLKRQADILREENAWLEQVAAEHLVRVAREMPNGEWAVDRQALLEFPLALQRRIVRAVVRRAMGNGRGPAFASVAAILDQVVHGRTGSTLMVQRTRVSREYETLRFRAAHRLVQDRSIDTVHCEVPLPIPSVQRWPFTGQVIQTSLVHSIMPHDQTQHESGTVALLDADRMTVKLSVRCWRPGDVFQPLGMGGRQKKLQDYFSDIKMPRHDRNRVPLIVAPEGLVWVGGHRMDHRFRLTPATKRVIMIRLADSADFLGTC
ncbi:MAG: tRNA lysidine(34) synthetase TilS [Nitrospiraceae bacterium]